MKESKSFENLQKTELKILPRLILHITLGHNETVDNYHDLKNEIRQLVNSF